MNYKIIRVSPLTGLLGCEVSGVDLSSLTAAAMKEIKAALGDHLVLVFRDQQNLTRERHLAFAKEFGDVLSLPHFPSVAEFPEIGLVKREAADQTSFFGETFHCDSTFLEKPPTIVVMKAVELPPCGGDTAFSNLCAAYEMLSDRMRELIDGLNVVHNDERIRIDPEAYEKSRYTAEPREAIHPLVLRHPDTGRKSIFLNPKLSVRFEGMTNEESAPLLNFLLGEIQSLPLTMRVRWEPDTVVVWDNRTAAHAAIGDYLGHARVLERVTIHGPATSANV